MTAIDTDSARNNPVAGEYFGEGRGERCLLRGVARQYDAAMRLVKPQGNLLARARSIGQRAGAAATTRLAKERHINFWPISSASRKPAAQCPPGDAPNAPHRSVTSQVLSAGLADVALR